MSERKSFNCMQCHSKLGETDGRSLYVGGVKLEGAHETDRSVKIFCSNCHKGRVWHPTAKTKHGRVLQTERKPL